MYIYHALINALSAHSIHINLNMILGLYTCRAQPHQNSLHKVLYLSGVAAVCIIPEAGNVSRSRKISPTVLDVTGSSHMLHCYSAWHFLCIDFDVCTVQVNGLGRVCLSMERLPARSREGFPINDNRPVLSAISWGKWSRFVNGSPKQRFAG